MTISWTSPSLSRYSLELLNLGVGRDLRLYDNELILDERQEIGPEQTQASFLPGSGPITSPWSVDTNFFRI